jgi:thiol:disulfide interchange protein
LASVALSRAETQGIAWLHDETKAVALARSSGRPILVSFHADWCAACEMMNRHTWSDRLVQAEIAQHFVPLSLDLTEDRPALKKRYGVSELPTILVLACGRQQARLAGYAGPMELLEQLTLWRRSIQCDSNSK